MPGTTRIGDYEVRQTSVVAGMVRYEATHIVLPRRAVIEILDPATPRTFAVRMLRHACILEALHHPGIPRVFECGMLDGRPWVAYERIDGPTLESDLGSRRLQLSEVLDSLPERSAIVMRMRFGLEDGRPRTLDEVGRFLGLTRERIRQIERDTLAEIRSCGSADALREYVA